MHKQFWSVLLIILLFYFLVFKGLVGNFDENSIQGFRKSGSPFESSHETAPYALMLSLMNDKSLSLSLPLAKIASPDSFYFDGKYYIYFSPVIPIIMIPFYYLGSFFNLSQILSYWGITLLGLSIYLFMYFICKYNLKMSSKAASLSMLVYALATTSLGYATTVYQHQFTAGIMLGLFYCGKKIASTKHKILFAILAAFLYVLGFWLDYPNMAILLPGLVYVCFQLFYIIDLKDKSVQITFSNLIYFLLGLVLVGVMGLGIYNFHYYRSPTKIINFLPRYAVDKPLVDAYKVKGKPINVLSGKKIISGMKVLTVAWDKGVFVFSPVLILGILGWFKKEKRFADDKFLGLTVMANLIIYSVFSDPWGGWAFGARYMIPSMTILSMYAVKWLTQKQTIFRKWLFQILYIISVYIAFAGAITTNLIPSSTEFASSGIKYFSFWQNFYLIMNNKISAFVYSEWLVNILPGWIYYILLICIAIGIGAYFIFDKKDTYEVAN